MNMCDYMVIGLDEAESYYMGEDSEEEEYYVGRQADDESCD